MLMMNVRRSRQAEGVLVVDIPLGQRLLPAMLGTTIFVAIAASILNGIPILAVEHIVPLTMVMLCLLGALYNESWVFDGGHKILTRQVGLLFAHASYRLAFAEIRALKVTGVIVRRPVRLADEAALQPVAGWRSYASLEVETAGGRRYRVEHVRGRRSTALVALARRIAERMTLRLDDRVVMSDAGPRHTARPGAQWQPGGADGKSDRGSRLTSPSARFPAREPGRPF